MKLEKVLTPDEVAEILKVKPQTLAAWRTRGVGPAFVRVTGRKILYRESDLVHWLDERTIKTAPSPRRG